MKIDTQGSAIYLGCIHVFKGRLGCEVEVEIPPIYEGQPVFHDVDRFFCGSKVSSFGVLKVFAATRKTPDHGFHAEIRFVTMGSGCLAWRVVSGFFWGNAIYLRDYKTLLGGGPLCAIC